MNAPTLPASSEKLPQSPSVDSSATSITKVIKTDESLSHAEGLKRFKELDRVIVAGLSQSLIVARALHEMVRGKYYTFGGYKTIAEYGSKIMKLAGSTVHQQVNAGRVAEIMAAVVKVIQEPAPNAAQELQQVVADLERMRGRGGP